ncbi:MAG: L-histidine N(alpha)-methyltransferase [Gammaproteobacteria bacterium]
MPKPLAAAIEIANDEAPTISNREEEILSGLRQTKKWISPKYFYDQRGSELFDQITELPEYYPTRTELGIMARCSSEIGEWVGSGASVIEFGAGSNIKIRLLLDCLDQCAAYVPVDISGDYLEYMAHALAADYPDLEVLPVLADFTHPFELPNPKIMPLRNLVFFPGSTIGNFAPAEALALLRVMHLEAKPGGALLIGVDLKKDRRILEAAYNDSQGVTAEFNLNVLQRLNNELGADFDINEFSHRAIYSDALGAIEMHLVSQRQQTVRLGGETIDFNAGEHITTEYSYKYALEDFDTLANLAGFQRQRVWTDPEQLFSVQLFRVPDTPSS